MTETSQEKPLVELVEEDLDQVQGGSKKKGKQGSVTLQDLNFTIKANKARPSLM